MIYAFKLLLLAATLALNYARVHNLNIHNDTRTNFPVSTFGFYGGGLLKVQLQNFIARPVNEYDVFGFSLYHTLDNVMDVNLDASEERCVLQENTRVVYDSALAYFKLDFIHKIMQVKCGPEWQKGVHIYSSIDNIPVKNPEAACEEVAMNLVSFTKANQTFYNTTFVIYVTNTSDEGLYSLRFNSCPNYDSSRKVTYDFSMVIVEMNPGGDFLSASETFLPSFYCAMAVGFFLLGCGWMLLLRRSIHPVFKVHYAMALMVFLKASAIGLRGINFYIIVAQGAPSPTVSVLFYIARYLDGTVLFSTLVLVGTGWTFLKHSLAFRDRALLMVMIPLQLLASIAVMIFDEGGSERKLWLNVYIFADFACCFCVLFPGIWSVQRVRKAAHVYGDAAVNLTRLFRWFYVMVVLYVYFTRIMRYLIKMSVTFQYGWVDDVFTQNIVYVFFLFLLYKFRPAALNPYLSLPSDEI